MTQGIATVALVSLLLRGRGARNRNLRIKSFFTLWYYLCTLVKAKLEYQTEPPSLSFLLLLLLLSDGWMYAVCFPSDWITMVLPFCSVTPVVAAAAVAVLRCRRRRRRDLPRRLIVFGHRACNGRIRAPFADDAVLYRPRCG